MAVVEELLREETDGTISFGNLHWLTRQRLKIFLMMEIFTR